MAIKAQPPLGFNDTVLVVGIDVGKQNHVAVAQGPGGQASKALPFANNQAGFERLVAWLAPLATRWDTTTVVVGLEPTGHYWKPLAEWLRRRGYPLRLVPPVFTQRAQELLDGSPLKSDAKDAHVIADLVRQGKSRALTNQDNIFQELRYLAEARRRVVRERTSLVNRLHRLLDLLFPELPALFHSIDCPTVRALLAVAVTPAEVVALGQDALARLLYQASRGRVSPARAAELLAAAGQSVGCRERVATVRLEVPLLLERLALVHAHRQLLEQEMKTALQQVDYASQLLSIPGLGVVTVAIALGELGDLRGYRHARQVVKKAGLNLFERSSGQHRGEHRITKRGRGELRRVLFMAVLRMFSAKGIFYSFHQRLVGTKPKPKIAVAAMRRLLVVMFALVRDGARFDARRLLGARPRQEMVA